MFHAKLEIGKPLFAAAFFGLLEWHRITKALPDWTPNESEAGLDYDRLAVCVKYVEKCTVACGWSLPEKPSNPPFKGEAAMAAIMKMLERLQKVCASRALLALARGGLVGKDTKAVLPSSHHSLAHVPQTDWGKERAALKAGDESLETLADKLPMCESALSCQGSSLLQGEEAFSKNIQDCKAYADMFLCGVDKLLDKAKDEIGSSLQAFHDNYQEVIPATEEWKLKDINWMFGAEAEKEVNADISRLKTDKKNSKEVCDVLDRFGNFTSASESITNALKKCSELKTFIEDYTAKASRVAGVMVYAEVVIAGSGDVEKAEKYCNKTFGVARDTLPEKLKDLLKGMGKKQPGKKEKKEKNETTEAASSSAHPRTKEKTEKSRKSDKHHNSSKRENSGNAPKENKAKKQ